MIVWITGRPAAGKTTLGRRLVDALRARGARATLIDSDEVREKLTPEPTYEKGERALVYRAMAYVARRLADEGVVAVVAATAHDPALRASVRAVAGEILLVHARCSLEEAERRDPKGIYRRARATERGTVPGVHVPFVEPEDADVTVDTEGGIDPRAIDGVIERVTR